MISFKQYCESVHDFKVMNIWQKKIKDAKDDSDLAEIEGDLLAAIKKRKMDKSSFDELEAAIGRKRRLFS